MLVRGTGVANIQAAVLRDTEAGNAIIGETCAVSIANKAKRTFGDTQVVAAELIVPALRVFHASHARPRPRVAMGFTIGRAAMIVIAARAGAHVAYQDAALVGLTCGIKRTRVPSRPFGKTLTGIAIVTIAPFNTVGIVIAGARSDGVTGGVDHFFAKATLALRVSRA